MEKTALTFFADMNRILQCYLLLEFAKITDPPRTGKKENFTVDNLIKSINWPQETRDRLTPLGDKTRGFRRHILGARNKLLAHTDKEIFLNDKTLGEFPEGKDEAFLQTLQEVCDVSHEACFGRIFGQMVLVKPGDVINFRRMLEHAVAFNELLSESSGEEKARLYSFLQKAGHHLPSANDKAQRDNGVPV
jgi:hypothetical protein